MSRRLQAPRGTFDVLGEQVLARDAPRGAARRVLEGAGYRRIETPAFEATELFARGVGESTDVVQKEMYTFAEEADGSPTRCARRARRPSAAPISSTACTSSRRR